MASTGTVAPPRKGWADDASSDEEDVEEEEEEEDEDDEVSIYIKRMITSLC